MSEKLIGNLVSREDWYKVGSEVCKQYSQVTMNIRTLAQQLVLAYSVGMGIVVSRGSSVPSGPNTSSSFCPISVWAGSILIAFAFVLYILNRHHSCAFRIIRDECLAPLEKECTAIPIGPWTAHQKARNSWKELFVPRFNLAWDCPFFALFLIGAASVILGSCGRLP